MVVVVILDVAVVVPVVLFVAVVVPVVVVVLVAHNHIYSFYSSSLYVI